MSPITFWTLILTASGAACLGNDVKVTLDYGTYVGYTDITSGFNVWKRSVNFATTYNQKHLLLQSYAG